MKNYLDIAQVKLSLKWVR